MGFYVPPVVRGQSDDNRQASLECLDIRTQEDALDIIRKQNKASLEAYEKLTAKGVCREQARGVLSQNLMTTFWATVDLGNLIHFLDLRDHEGAQWEIQQYAKAIKQLITPIVPHVAEVCNW
jgi:thymidylate synthase (FAD)